MTETGETPVLLVRFIRRAMPPPQITLYHRCFVRERKLSARPDRQVRPGCCPAGEWFSLSGRVASRDEMGPDIKAGAVTGPAIMQQNLRSLRLHPTLAAGKQSELARRKRALLSATLRLVFFKSSDLLLA